MRVGRVVPVLLVLAAGCGGSVVDTSPTLDAGRHREGGRPGSGGAGGTNLPPPDDASPNDDFPVFREDACPDVYMDPPTIECDPFAQSTCGPGLGCYPIPPRATDNCHPGKYSTMCLPAGQGTQGSPCGDGTDCAGGFICVKSGEGDQCVKLCRTDQFNSCTDGRVCREVDVTGSEWGGCE